MIIQSLSQINSLSRPKYLVIFGILQQNLKFSLDRKSSQIADFIITATLHLTYILAARPIRLFFRIDTKMPAELQRLSPNRRYVVVCNHQTGVDPYLILTTLPYKSLLTLLPIRFFTANKFLRFWWQRLILGAFGSFRAYSTEGKISGVRGGLHFSDKGQTLFIFPQGKRVRGSLGGELKIGIGYMVQHRNFTILPVYISDIKASPKGTTHVRWGKPVNLSPQEVSKELPELTSHIFSHVIALSDS